VDTTLAEEKCTLTAWRAGAEWSSGYSASRVAEVGGYCMADNVRNQRRCVHAREAWSLGETLRRGHGREERPTVLYLTIGNQLIWELAQCQWRVA